MEKREICQKCPSPSCLSISLFGGLNKAQSEELSHRAYLSSYDEGDYLFHVGDPASHLFLIKEGDVKLVTYDIEGREKIVTIFGQNELIWEGLFLNEASFPFSAVAVNKALVCKIPSSFVEEVLKEGNSALMIVEILSKKLHDANERNMILSTSSPKAKVARLFVYRASQTHSNAITMKLEDIAAYVSLRPETVSRKLGELIRDGLLEKTGQSSFYVKDMRGLVDAAEN